MALLSILLYIVFVLSAIVLVVVVLLQEGRGGGLTDALGTSGQATFGVGAAGINRFTFVMVGVFLCSALAIHYVNRSVVSGSILNDKAPASAPATPPATPPADAPAK